MAPSFVKKPQLRQEDDGNRLIFECKLSGSPKPEVVWFNEDVKIVDDERTSIKVVEDGKNQFAVILELNDVVETDAGLYKVKAKNKYGEVSASINLNFSRKYRDDDDENNYDNGKGNIDDVDDRYNFLMLLQ